MKNRLLAVTFMGLVACGSSGSNGGAGNSNPPPANGETGGDPVGIPPGLAVDCRHIGKGRDIQVGNSATESGPKTLQFSKVSDVDWNNLAAGDTVRIFWRAEPYREKILIKGQGSAEQPIRVCGVAGPNGELPVISGRDATSRPDLDFGDIQYHMEDLGVVTVYNRDYFQRPEHIRIEGLKIVDTLANPGRVGDDQGDEYVPIDEYHYTATTGERRPYLEAAACLRIQEGLDIAIRGNELSNCGNGLFILSRVPEAQMSRDLVIDGNSIHDNGAINSDQMHNAYVQGVNVLVQGNRFGDSRPNSMGGNLKMRTAGDIVRYNYFGKGARILDFVEVEDHAELVLPWRFAEFKADGGEVTPGDEARVADAWEAYQKSYVYGNVILNRGPNASNSVVHYSYDNLQEDRRPGTLYFYNNTVVLQSDFAEHDINILADQGPWNGNSETGFPNGIESYATIQAFNNVIYLGGLGAQAQRSYFEFTRFRPDKLSLGLGANWISSAWNDAVPGYDQAFPGFGNRCSNAEDCSDNSATYANGNATHHVSGAAGLLTGSGAPIDLQTYLPLPGSSILGAAGPWPAELSEAYQPKFQIDPVSGAVSERSSISSLGALEGGGR